MTKTNSVYSHYSRLSQESFMAIVNLLISISFIFILLWPCFTVMQHTAPCTIAINFYLTGREVSFGNVLSKGIGRPNFRGSQTYFESSKINIKLWNFNWQNWIVKLICFITCSLSKMKHNDQSQIWSFLPNLCLYMLNYMIFMCCFSIIKSFIFSHIAQITLISSRKVTVPQLLKQHS